MEKSLLFSHRIPLFFKRVFSLKRTVLIMALILSIASYGSVYSQLSISISIKSTNLKSALNELKNKAGVNILFDSQQTSAITCQNMVFQDCTVDEILQKLLLNTGLQYKVVEEVYVITKAQTTQTKAAQSRTIKGVVTDENRKPLLGASVSLKSNPMIGTSTNAEGQFELKVPASQGDQFLVVTFIGMIKNETKLTESSNYVILLKNENLAVDEVVVTGYFQRARDSYTGAATSYSAEKLRTVSNQNMLTTLSMLDPTFKLVENNELGSDPNKVPEFQIRGSGSINGIEGEYKNSPNMPTFILDGFEVSAAKIFDLDPNRVASITILKDAAATAIYGSRAANGVVVVETKAPEAGAIKLTYNLNLDFDIADLSDYTLMNSREKLDYEVKAKLYDWSTNIGVKETYLERYNERLKLVSRGNNTDWIRKPIRPLGFGNKHSVMLEGGVQSFRYALNVNYANSVGVMKGSGRDKIGAGVTLQYNFQKIKFRNDMSFDNVTSKNSPYGNFSTYAYLNPYFTPYDENNQLKPILYTYSGYSFQDKKEYNPLYDASLNIKDQSHYDNFINNFSLDWSILPGLRLTAKLALNKQTSIAEKFLPAEHSSFVGAKLKGSYSKSTNESFSYDGNAVVTFNKQLGKHSLNLAGVYNITQSKEDGYGTTSYVFPNSNLDHIGMGVQYKEGDSPSGSESTTRLMGVVGNFNYSYDQRYLVDLSIRSDASSLFGANNRWGTFGSAGIGWNIHREQFLQDSQWINLLKLRGSWGLTGGQNFYAYQSLMMYTYKSALLDKVSYNGYLGALLKAFGNPNLKWQRTEKSNIGLDFEFLKRRISGSLNVYSEVSKNVLVDVTVAPSVGFSTYKENLGKVENRGVELSLRANVINNPKKDIQWSVFASGTINRNKLLEINDALTAYNKKNDEKMFDEDIRKPMVRFQEGTSINTLWANKSNGINPVDGQEMFWDLNGELTTTWSPLNYQPLGCTDPDLEGNFGTTFSYKDLQLNIYMSYSFGGDIYNQTLVDRVENADPYRNADKRVYYSRWQEKGVPAAFKSISNTTKTYPTSRFIERNNFLNISSVSLTYEFNRALIKRMGLERMKLTALCNDVARFSTVKAERGINYPYAKHYSLVLQVVL